MKHVVVLTGAGISADSGLQTFRGLNGLWNGYRIEEVASPEGWHKDPKQVLDFYNMRRQEIKSSKPNEGHLALAKLEKKFKVSIITQNIDDLHERAGSSEVLHLHGEIVYARSELDPDLTVHIGYQDLAIGQLAPDGTQLRPNIVWFGEPVPKLQGAANLVSKADIFIVAGTSLQVYPAAGLVDYAPAISQNYVVDIDIPEKVLRDNFQPISMSAAEGLPKLVKTLLLQTT